MATVDTVFPENRDVMSEALLRDMWRQGHGGRDFVFSGFGVTDGGGLQAVVAAGEAYIEGTKVDRNVATSLTMTNNQTNYIFLYFREDLNDDTVYFEVNTTGTPPSYPNILLATVVTSGGVITTINDKRNLFPLKDDTIGSSQIADDAVGSAQIQDDAIITARIADGAVTGPKIATGAVGSTAIGPDAVGASEIAANAVGASELGPDAVGSEHIEPDAVGSAQIQDSAIITARIADGAITGIKIATGAVGSTAIGAGAVGASEIAANAVGASELGPDAVGSEHVEPDAIGSAQIQDSAIITARIANGAVTGPKIATGAVGSTAIGADAVGASEIAANAVGAPELANDAVGSEHIESDAVGSAQIQDGAVTTERIAVGAITSNFRERSLGIGSERFPLTTDLGSLTIPTSAGDGLLMTVHGNLDAPDGGTVEAEMELRRITPYKIYARTRHPIPRSELDVGTPMYSFWSHTGIGTAATDGNEVFRVSLEVIESNLSGKYIRWSNAYLRIMRFKR